MKICELLSPAGNMEMLKYAVQYGADAVYLAGTRFGARKFANNFNDEELITAVKYAHLYNVKIYVTINTLIYEYEIEDFVEYVKFVHKIGVDAVLVQDFGMLSLIRKFAPDLEIHASTQFHNDGENTIKFLEKYGVKRVVVDREMNLDEIKNLSKKIEIEVFCHGALCVSYSGQCLFSSQILNRSGNRGECAGLCRLPYSIKDGDKIDEKPEYHLSLKDLNTTDYISELLDNGITCLKIEGRMKSPEYVGYMTKIYRKLIDSYYDGSETTISDEENRNIRILFNRGMTKGFLKGVHNDEIVNRTSPNHIGIHLGTYKPLKDKVELHLAEELHQGDTIRFLADNKGMTVNFLYDKKDNLINHSSKDTIVYVDNFLGIEQSDELRLVASASLTEEIANLPTKKIPITMNFRAHKDCEISLKVSEREYTITTEGPVPERAKSKPISKEDIERQLKKTGATAYVLSDIFIDLEDDLFINLSDLNDLRRRALSKLDEIRTTPCEVKFREIDKISVNSIPKRPELIIIVENVEQYEIAKKYTSLIFSSNEELTTRLQDIYPKYVDCHKKIESSKYLVCDYGLLLNKKDSDDVFTDYMMNVTNSYTAQALIDLGVRCVTLSLEMTLPNIKAIKEYTDMSKLAILTYGHVELMKMKYNPLEKRGTHLVDRNSVSYRIKQDATYNYLMSSTPINIIDGLDEYLKLGIGYYRLDFTVESKEECSQILEKVHKILYKE